MSGLEDVLALLITDRSFREALTTDPAAALAGYDLSREDLEILAASLDEQVGGERVVEQRTSKSALLGMLGALAVDDDAASGLPTGKPRHNPFPVTTPRDQGASGNVAEDEFGLFAEPMEQASTSPEASRASSFQQGTGDGSADAVRRWNVEGAWVHKTTGPSPAPAAGEDGESLIAEASHDATAEDPHEDEIEIQSLHHVADDGGATGGGEAEVMDGQTGIDVRGQNGAPPAGSDGDPDAPIVVGSPWNDADAAQHQESDLAFVHERSSVEVEHDDLSAGEAAAEVDGEAIAESLDVKPEGKNGIEAEDELQQHDRVLGAAPEGADGIGEHPASSDEGGA